MKGRQSTVHLISVSTVNRVMFPYVFSSQKAQVLCHSFYGTGMLTCIVFRRHAHCVSGSWSEVAREVQRCEGTQRTYVTVLRLFQCELRAKILKDVKWLQKVLSGEPYPSRSLLRRASVLDGKKGPRLGATLHRAMWEEGCVTLRNGQRRAENTTFLRCNNSGPLQST